METLTTTTAMKAWSRAHLTQGKSIGLVPTMGYLHEGHLSLMRRARSENDLVVVSIFVNPTQFGPNEDLDRYPRDPDGDAAKCKDVGVAAIYSPQPSEVSGPYFQTYVTVEDVAAPMCGSSRPGHFRGVATVVLKLFNVVVPTRAYFGMKDYQQVQVIKRMVNDLDVDVQIVPCETVREPDGIAMSSRNAYLSPDERKQGLALYQALLEARKLFENGEKRGTEYLRVLTERIQQEPNTEIDYVSLVHPDTLEELQEINNRALAALAVRIGKTRLIDNMLFEK